MSLGDKDRIVKRLHRIGGQIKAIEKMIEADTDYDKMMIQMQAVSSAIESTKIELVRERIKKSVSVELGKALGSLK